VRIPSKGAKSCIHKSAPTLFKNAGVLITLQDFHILVIAGRNAEFR